MINVKARIGKTAEKWWKTVEESHSKAPETYNTHSKQHPDCNLQPLDER